MWEKIVDPGTIATVITLLLTVLGSFFGGKWLLKVKKLLKAAKEGGDVVGVLTRVTDLADKAGADNVYTKEEVTAIIEEVKRGGTEWKEFVAAFKDLIGQGK
jgi:hypothetical protein